MNLTQFIERHPHGFAAILEASVVIAYLAAGTAAHLLGLPNLALYGLANLGLTLIAALLLTRLKWWKRAGFRPLHSVRDLLYFLVPLIPVGLNAIPGVQVGSFAQISSVLAITAMVAFAEEALFRGLMLQAIQPRGHWRAVLLSAALFGLTHAMNALTGKSAPEIAMQIGYAVAVGFAYAALALKKEVLWPLVLTHFLTDLVYFIQKPGFVLPPFWQTFSVLSLTILFSVHGVLVMRQKPRQQQETPSPTQ